MNAEAKAARLERPPAPRSFSVSVARNASHSNKGIKQASPTPRLMYASFLFAARSVALGVARSSCGVRTSTKMAMTRMSKAVVELISEGSSGVRRKYDKLSPG